MNGSTNDYSASLVSLAYRQNANESLGAAVSLGGADEGRTGDFFNSLLA
jgi:hypothetical protein